MKSGTCFLAGSLLLSVLLTGCGGSSDSQRQGTGQFGQRGGGQITSVEAVPVSAGTISDQIRSFGTIRAQDVVQITPQVSNRITAIHVDLGDSVQRGEVMASIYDIPFRDDLEQALAQFRQAQSAFERDSSLFVRQELLYESGAISRSEFEESRAVFQGSRSQLEAAGAALTQSRENLANTEIRSPVEGVVLRRLGAVGDVAATGQPLFEVANTAGYETRVWLPMQEWIEISVGLPVELRLSSREEVIAEGFVSRISPQLDPESGLGEVVITLSSAGSRVRQGSLVEARVILVTHENTVVIPRSSMIEQVETYIEPETNTVELRRSHSVFVAVGDTIAEQRTVSLGLQQGERVEVVDGLEVDEKLIITGHRSLSDGGRIRVAGSEARLERPESVGSGQRRPGSGGPSRAGGRN